jgi:Flp pilus assembly protein TadG
VSRRQRAGERGQAIIETAVVIAVILTILMGVYAVSQFASDQNTAGTATRAGARLASELGNGGYDGSTASAACQGGNPKDPCAVDRQIVQSVCQVAATMPFVTSVAEVDIYRATGSGGTGDVTDRYTCSSLTPISFSYTLDLRIQTHPIEAYIGVSITYNYKSPLPLVPLTTQATVYTVTQMSPHFT